MAMPGRHCLSCTHWRPAVPEDWQPSYNGQAFGGVIGLRYYLNQKGHVIADRGWPGACHLNPVAIPARSLHECAQHRSSHEFIQGEDWFLTAFDRVDREEVLKKRLRDEMAKSKELRAKLRALRAKQKEAADV